MFKVLYPLLVDWTGKVVVVHVTNKYLDYLHQMGHPGYKFYDDWNTYKRRCSAEDPKGLLLVFPEPENEIIDFKASL